MVAKKVFIYALEFIQGMRVADILLYGKWLRSLRSSANALTDRAPWITYRARKFLDTFLNPRSNVFEWGSGGSTAYFEDRTAGVVSVEHDRGWLGLVRGHINQKGGSKVTLRLVEPVNEGIGGETYISADPAYSGKNFYSYCATIDAYPNGSFDCILIDGRARNGCIQHAIPKLKSSGVIVVDNTDRAEYGSGVAFLTGSGFKEKRLYGLAPYLRRYSCTSIFYKQ